MAAESFIGEFCDETTCILCLQCFKDPVTVDCGHNFCQACLNQYWEESDQEPSCPQCRELVQKKQLKPNRQLANIAQLVKKLQECRIVEAKKDMCGKHQELLKLFCSDHVAPICRVCEKSKEHRNHNVVPIEEAVQVYKEKFRVVLEILKKERERIMNLKSSEEQRKQEYWKKFELEHQKARSAFDRMKQFLEEKQKFWMVNLEEMVMEREKRCEENIIKLTQGISRLCQLTAEIEERCEQSASKFLQNIKNDLNRYQENIEEYTQDISSKMEEKLRYASLKNSILEKFVENYKGYLGAALNPDIFQQALNPDNLKRLANKVCVSLDPDTAHPYLNLSEDLKTVSWESRRKKREYLKKKVPNNPERFDWETCVLGSQKFTSGIHWWVVEIQGTGSWAIGVAKDSIKKKGLLNLNPDEGVWALRKPFRSTHSTHEILAVVLPEPIVLTVAEELTKILVALDYEGSQVDFFDGNTNAFIFSFHVESFSGETIRPFFDMREWGFSLHCLS